MLLVDLPSGFSGNIWLGLGVELGLPFEALGEIADELRLPIRVMSDPKGTGLLDTRLIGSLKGSVLEMMDRLRDAPFDDRILTAASAMLCTRFLADDLMTLEDLGRSTICDLDYADTLFDLTAAAVLHSQLGWPKICLISKVEMGSPSPPSVVRLARSLPTQSSLSGAELLTPTGATNLVHAEIVWLSKPIADATAGEDWHEVLSPFAHRLRLPPARARLVTGHSFERSNFGGRYDQLYVEAILGGVPPGLVASDGIFLRFCRAVGLPDHAGDSRFRAEVGSCNSMSQVRSLIEDVRARQIKGF